jgi:hypothetical protein
VNGLHLYAYSRDDGLVGVEAYSREQADALARRYDGERVTLLYVKQLKVNGGLSRVAFFVDVGCENGAPCGTLRSSGDYSIMRGSDG